MSNPPVQGSDSPEDFIKSLSPDQIKNLAWIIKVVGMVHGWCLVNRAIGKFLIVSIIGLLILFSQALDAVKNLFGWKH